MGLVLWVVWWLREDEGHRVCDGGAYVRWVTAGVWEVGRTEMVWSAVSDVWVGWGRSVWGFGWLGWVRLVGCRMRAGGGRADRWVCGVVCKGVRQSGCFGAGWRLWRVAGNPGGMCRYARTLREFWMWVWWWDVGFRGGAVSGYGWWVSRGIRRWSGWEVGCGVRGVRRDGCGVGMVMRRELMTALVGVTGRGGVFGR